jgi:hypothetical protein
MPGPGWQPRSALRWPSLLCLLPATAVKMVHNGVDYGVMAA